MIHVDKHGQNPPQISILVIDSRGNDHPKWVAECLASCRNQTLSDYELIILDNRKKEKSIGRCFNELVENASAPWVLFVGDDDYLMPDFLEMLSVQIRTVVPKLKKPYAIITGMLNIDVNGNLLGIGDTTCQGAFLRELLVKNPFDTLLKNLVDTDKHEYFLKRGYQCLRLMHYYGYVVRNHAGRVSGQKRILKATVEEKMRLVK